MLIQESYNMIDTSNANTIKDLTEKVKRKEAKFLATHSKALSAAREEVIVLKMKEMSFRLSWTRIGRR